MKADEKPKFYCMIDVGPPRAKGLTDKRLREAILRTLNVHGEQRAANPDVVVDTVEIRRDPVPAMGGRPTLVEFELRPLSGPSSDVGGISIRALSIVREAINNVPQVEDPSSVKLTAVMVGEIDV